MPMMFWNFTSREGKVDGSMGGIYGWGSEAWVALDRLPLPAFFSRSAVDANDSWGGFGEDEKAVYERRKGIRIVSL